MANLVWIHLAWDPPALTGSSISNLSGWTAAEHAADTEMGCGWLNRGRSAWVSSTRPQRLAVLGLALAPVQNRFMPTARAGGSANAGQTKVATRAKLAHTAAGHKCQPPRTLVN